MLVQDNQTDFQIFLKQFEISYYIKIMNFYIFKINYILNLIILFLLKIIF